MVDDTCDHVWVHMVYFQIITVPADCTLAAFDDFVYGTLIVAPIPIPLEVIDRVHRISERQRSAPGLAFLRRNGDQIVEVISDDISMQSEQAGNDDPMMTDDEVHIHNDNDETNSADEFHDAMKPDDQQSRAAEKRGKHRSERRRPQSTYTGSG